jgi:Amt family ammonium transporter
VPSSISGQLLTQGKGVLVTLVYTLVMSYIILKVIDVIIGLRVTEEEETQGLDLSEHDECGYIL